jgi:hypothetical protein
MEILTWVPGNQLRAADKAHALRVFTHRRRDMDDATWLACHYFPLRRDGGLDLRCHAYRTLRDIREAQSCESSVS